MLDFASVISRFCTSVRKNGQRPYRSRSSPMSASANAAPQPYHAGKRQRFCVQANTHGIARSDPRNSAPSGRRDGREPMLSKRELVHRRECSEEGDEPRILNEFAVRRARALGERCDERRIHVLLSTAPCEHGRGERGLEVAVRELRQPVLERDRLALLGDLQVRVGLGEDGIEGRAAPASGAAAASVEHGERDVVPPRDLRERDERGADLPLSGEIARVLRRVGVADHHLAAQQFLVDSRRGAERLNRFEQRDDVRRRRQRANTDYVLGRRDAGHDHGLARSGEKTANALVRVDRVARVHAHLDVGEVEVEELDTAAQRGE